jgi:hypothetical protein
MQTKLTLRLEEQLIEEAKQVAKDRGTSVSKLVSDYFGSLKSGKEVVKSDLSPVTQSLVGVMENTDLSEEKYKNHLNDGYHLGLFAEQRAPPE